VIDFVVTKILRAFNFPFFVGIMCFVVPMALFDGKIKGFSEFKMEFVEAWIDLRDYDLGLIFVLIWFVVGFYSIDRGLKSVSYQKEGGDES